MLKDKMATTASRVLCPTLAEEEIIITKDNMNSLSLSTYERYPGTTVTVSCLSKDTHQLIGASVITCLDTGQWNAAIPTCEQIPHGIAVPTLPASTVAPQMLSSHSTDLSLLPYMIGLGVLAAVCIMLAILLFHSCYLLRKRKRKSELNLTDGNSFFNRPSSPSSQRTELWVDMAGLRHFRSHELAASGNNSTAEFQSPVHAWSGY